MPAHEPRYEIPRVCASVVATIIKRYLRSAARAPVVANRMAHCAHLQQQLLLMAHQLEVGRVQQASCAGRGGTKVSLYIVCGDVQNAPDLGCRHIMHSIARLDDAIAGPLRRQRGTQDTREGREGARSRENRTRCRRHRNLANIDSKSVCCDTVAVRLPCCHRRLEKHQTAAPALDASVVETRSFASSSSRGLDRVRPQRARALDRSTSVNSTDKERTCMGVQARAAGSHRRTFRQCDCGLYSKSVKL